MRVVPVSVCGMAVASVEPPRITALLRLSAVALAVNNRVRPTQSTSVGGLRDTSGRWHQRMSGIVSPRQGFACSPAVGSSRRKSLGIEGMESQMHAVVMTQRGGPDVLRLVTIDVPKLRTPRDALIRVHAAGVNPSDWQIRTRPLASYLAKQLSGGLILGMEGTGVIAAVGSAVARFRVDEEVYYVDGGLGLHQGNYAQYKVVDAQYLARKPVSLSFSSAGAVPVALITAWESLYERAQVKAGDWALIHGGAGGCGDS